MKNNLALFRTAIAIILITCAASVSIAEEFTVLNKMPQEGYQAYYESFIHRVRECHPGNNRYYHSISNFERTKLSEANKYGGMKVYMLRDGRYIAEFNLLEPLPEHSASAMKILKTEYRFGNWQIVGDKLELSNLGTGRAVDLEYSIETDRAIEMTITTDSSDPFSGAVFYLEGSHSTSVYKELEIKCN